MKKLIYCALALAAGLFASSCQQENLEPVAQENTVTYTVEVPGVDTKAIGDGQNVDQLVYEVWKTGEDGVITDKSTRLYQKTIDLAPDAPRKWIVSLNLVQNQTYKTLFWAQVGKPEGHENYNTDQLTNVHYAYDVTKDYSSNQESYAAFYGTDVLDTHTPLKGKTITLTRPFAQLNIGTLNTALEDEYAIDMLQSSVEVTVPTQFNVATSEVDNHQKISFALADVPSDPKVLPVSGTDYDYVAMNYVFAGANTSVEYTINTTITPSGATEGTPATINKTIPNVPLKENYRTNIVGNLLTSSAEYEVVIDKEFNTPDELVDAWNGTEINEPKKSAEDENVYEIEYSSELAWLAAAVNGTLPETRTAPAADSFAGKTFKLIDNVDLGNNEWTPIGNSANPFKGTFDGNGKTVKNLKITGKNSNVGLFGMTTDGEIKNLTVENAIVSGRLNVGVVAGTPYTSKYTNITVQGHVEVNGMSYVGGVAGKNAYADWTNITVTVDETSYVKANSIENGTAYRSYVGGVVGFNGEGGHSFKNITSNIDVDGSTCDVGGLFGIAHYGNQFENCSCSGDVEIYAAEEADEAQEIGGIAGVWNNGGADVVMTNCEFTGTITTNIDRETVWYSNLVGRPYSATGTGRLIIDGNVVVASANTLQAAINGAKDGDIIKLVDDITVSETSDPNGNVVYYTGDKSFTIDLNGKEVKGNTSNVVFRFQKAEGEVNTITIKNGTVEALENCWSAISIGSSASTKTYVNLVDLTVKSQKTNDMAVRARSGAEFTMTNCTVVATESAGGICAGGGNVTLNNVTVNQTGWYSNNWNSVALGISGGAKMTINSGSYTSNPNGDTRGTWVAYVMSSGGILEINGGSFNGTVGQTANSANACGLICADAKAVVNINGGEFNSTGAILDMRNNSGATPNPKAVLAGGTFSADPRVSGLYSSNLISVAKGYEVKGENGTYVVSKKPEANVNGTPYVGTFAEAVASAKSGDIVTVLDDVTLSESLTLPAGIIFNGNGKQIDGTINAGGNLTFAGHTKVTAFSASYYNRTITIGEGACLEVTGTGRVTLGYGNTFNITGNIDDAKTADKANIQPSLIIPAGISITGGNDAAMNVTNAYIKIGSTTSKPEAANGKFSLNFDNSIVEFTKELGFYEPTGGMKPAFSMNIENSVFTTGTKLFLTNGSEVTVDNSTVALGSYIRNSGVLNLINGSTLTGATIQFGENGGNDGSITVDNSSLTILGGSAAYAFDGRGVGCITAKNKAAVEIDYVKDMILKVGDDCTFTYIKLDNCSEVVTNAEELTSAFKEGKNVILYEDIYSEASTTAPYGNKYGYKMDGGVLDGNGYELDIECYGDDYGIMTSGGTIKNLKIDNATRAIMVMYVNEDLTLDNVNIGGDGVLYPINTGEAGPAAETAKLTVSNSTLAGWTSYAFFASATFTNVEFKHGTYYNNIYGRVLKPYVNTTLTNCSFVEHMNLDLSGLANGHKVTMTNCTVNGQAVTAEVMTVPSSDAEYDTKLFTVDLPSWATSINDCIIFN